MLQSFFSAVLPPTGHYRLVLLPGTTRQYPKTLWADSLEAFIALAEQHAGQDRVYFGTASYRSTENGDAANVLLNTALRLDIDAGPEKLAKHGDAWVYASQAEALQAVAQFGKTTGLKPTHVVSSGAGWHIYYALADALEPMAWTALAGRLFQLCLQHGIKVDNTTTCDITRLLRVPGSVHENGTTVEVKGGRGRPYSAQEIDALLPAQPHFSAADLDVNAAFEDNSEVEYPPSSIRKILERCPELRPVIKAKGNVQEPLWRAMLGLLKHTVEGEKFAHLWSSGYDGYDEGETQRKLDGWKTGPTTMEELAKYIPELRQSRHWGKVKSPIQLGHLTDKEQEEQLPEEQRTTREVPPPAPEGKPWDDHLPPNTRVLQVKRAHHLQRCIAVKDAAGNTSREWVTVATTPFWFARWGEATAHSDAVAVLRTYSAGRVVQHEMPQVNLASVADLTKFLASKAVHLSSTARYAKEAFVYAKDQFALVQNMDRDFTFSDHFGLHVTDDGQLVALQGRHVIAPDGTIRDSILGQQLASQSECFAVPLPALDGFQDTWTPDVWGGHIVPLARRHVDFLKQHYTAPGLEPLQVAIMAVLSSPLMPFVTGEWRGGRLPPMSSLNVSLYSRQGGAGKTTACQAAALAFGPPSMLVSGQGNDATTNFARFSRLAASGSMPSVMDEMGAMAPHQVYNLLSAVANGSDRSRLRKDGSARPTSPWALVNVLTTNRALQELLTSPGAAKTDAVQRRILEIDVGAIPMHDVEARTRFAADYGRVVAESAGALGAVLHRELCRLGVEGVHKLVVASVTKAAELLGAGQADRFIYRGLGAILTCGQILHSVGLLPFDLRAVVQAFKRAYDRSINAIEVAGAFHSPLQLLSQMLSDVLPNTIIVDRDVSGKGNTSRVLNVRLPVEVHARHVAQTGYTYVSVDAVKKWCIDNGASQDEVIDAGVAAGIIPIRKLGGYLRPYIRRNLQAGLEQSTGQSLYVYSVDTRMLERFFSAESGLDYAADLQNVVTIPLPGKKVAQDQQEETRETA